MKWILIVAALIIVARLLHILFLWMERKGWIYYKHNTPSRTRLGTAFLELQSILEPDKKHMIELRSELKKASAEAGDEAGDGDEDEALDEAEADQSRP